MREIPFDSSKLKKRWKQLIALQIVSALIMIAITVGATLYVFNKVEEEGGIRAVIVETGKEIKSIAKEISEE